MTWPTKRSEAVCLGKRFYRTNKPCKRGHVAVRNVGNQQCSECERERRNRDRRTKLWQVPRWRTRAGATEGLI